MEGQYSHNLSIRCTSNKTCRSRQRRVAFSCALWARCCARRKVFTTSLGRVSRSQAWPANKEKPIYKTWQSKNKLQSKKNISSKNKHPEFPTCKNQTNFQWSYFQKTKNRQTFPQRHSPGAWHSTSCTRLGSESLPSKATCARWRSCTSRGSPTETPWRSKDWSSSALLWPHANKTSRS